MSYCVEFGLRGGAHTDNLVLPSLKLSVKLACSLVAVFTNNTDHTSANPSAWWITSKQHGKRTDREYWQNDTHFVSISKLPRTDGPASAQLWKVSK